MTLAPLLIELHARLTIHGNKLQLLHMIINVYFGMIIQKIPRLFPDAIVDAIKTSALFSTLQVGTCMNV